MGPADWTPGPGRRPRAVAVDLDDRRADGRQAENSAFGGPIQDDLVGDRRQGGGWADRQPRAEEGHRPIWSPVISVNQRLPSGTGRDPRRDAVGRGDGEFGDRAGGGDPADLVARTVR